MTVELTAAERTESKNEETDYSSANMMQLRCQVSSELTGCS